MCVVIIVLGIAFLAWMTVSPIAIRRPSDAALPLVTVASPAITADSPVAPTEPVSASTPATEPASSPPTPDASRRPVVPRSSPPKSDMTSLVEGLPPLDPKIVSEAGDVCSDVTDAVVGQKSMNFDPEKQLRCPPRLPMLRDNNDTDMDRQSDWIEKKYIYYASRCNKTKGMMWKQLSRNAHDVIATRVMDLLSMRQIYATRGGRIDVFDWASGCGVSLHFLRHQLQTERSAGRGMFGLGVDLIEAAVRYANTTFGAKELLYCSGDGTQLSWIPNQSFDIITSFGGLLHLPKSFMCTTIEHLVRILRPGGSIWAGYIDNAETMKMLLSCRVPCPSAGGNSKTSVRVFTIEENKWLKGAGVPAANRKRRPKSIVWEKRYVGNSN